MNVALLNGEIDIGAVFFSVDFVSSQSKINNKDK
jgi:hypothetical protein